MRQLMLDIHVESEASIREGAAFKKQLAKVADGMNTVEICEGERHEVLRTGTDFGDGNSGIVAGDEPKRLWRHVSGRVNWIENQVHGGGSVRALTPERLASKRRDKP